MKPSLGRIVHYVIPDTKGRGPAECPGVITRVWSDTCVNLRLLPDHDSAEVIAAQPQQFVPTSVCMDEQLGPRTWHWPERVD